MSPRTCRWQSAHAPPAENHVSSRAPYAISIRHATADRCPGGPFGSSGAAGQRGDDSPAADGPEVDEILEFVTGQTLEMTGADLVVLPGEGHRQLAIRHAAGNGAARRQLPSVTRSLARLRADRRLFAPSCRCSPPCGGAQIIYSAAGGRRPVPYVGAVCPRCVMPLDYEYYDVRIRCLTQSPLATLTRFPVPESWPTLGVWPHAVR
jgi:hypothetical protein